MTKRYNERDQQFLFGSQRAAILWALVGGMIALAAFIAVALFILHVGRNLG